MNKRVVAIVGGAATGVLLVGIGMGVGNATQTNHVNDLEKQVTYWQREMGDHELHEEFLNGLQADLERREAAVKAREDAVGSCND